MHVIAEITSTTTGRTTVSSAPSISSLTCAVKAYAQTVGDSFTVDVWRWPGSDYQSVDWPTWRIIRTPSQFIRQIEVTA